MGSRKGLTKKWICTLSAILVVSVSMPVSAENPALGSGKSKLSSSSLEAAPAQPGQKIQVVPIGNGVLGTGYTGLIGWCQPFMDLTASGSDVLIDGFEVYFKGTLTRTVNVYYKSGSYAGSETTPGNWTLFGAVEVSPGGDGTLTSVPLGGLTIPAGETYGFYFWDGVTGNSDGPGLEIRIGGTNASDGILSLSSTNYTCGDAFAELYQNFGWQGSVLYSDVSITTPVPGLNTWGLIGLVGLIGLFGFQIRRRHQD